MTERIHIKPARPGLRVVDPTTNIPIPDEGRHVVPGQYWLRRLADGDVIRIKGGARKSTRQSAPQHKDDAASEV